MWYAASWPPRSHLISDPEGGWLADGPAVALGAGGCVAAGCVGDVVGAGVGVAPAEQATTATARSKAAVRRPIASTAGNDTSPARITRWRESGRPALSCRARAT